MDGTIYPGSRLLPFTIAFLQHLKTRRLGYSFFRTNRSKSTNGYLSHLATMGIVAGKEEMDTAAEATSDYIQNDLPQVRRLFILGTPSMSSEFEAEGFISTSDDPTDVPDAVVVAFDMSLSYARLCRAVWWVSQQLPYVATNPDRVCPTDQQIILVDCGAV